MISYQGKYWLQIKS